MKYKDKEYTLKDFNKAKNRRDYWFPYTKLVEAVAKEGTVTYIISQVFKENEDKSETVTCFDEFLKSFIEGDFDFIKEEQLHPENEYDLIMFTGAIVNDFLSLNRNSVAI